MAWTACAKCANRFFELSEHEPTGSRVKINLVQCSSCGTPVGAMEYYNAGSLLKIQEKTLNDLSSRLSRVENLLMNLVSAMRQR